MTGRGAHGGAVYQKSHPEPVGGIAATDEKLDVVALDAEGFAHEPPGGLVAHPHQPRATTACVTTNP